MAYPDGKAGHEALEALANRVVNQAIEECEAESARGEPPAPTAAKGFVEFPGKEDSEETLREGKKTMATLRSTAAARRF